MTIGTLTAKRHAVVHDVREDLERLICPDVPSRPRPRASRAPKRTEHAHDPRPERLLTAKDVASMLNVHENYVYDLAARGLIPSYKIGGNRRFRRGEIEDWVDQQRSGTYNPSTGMR